MEEKSNLKKIKLRLGDFILIGLVLLAAAGIAAPFLLAPSHSLYCEVRQSGELIRRVKLVEGYKESFAVKGKNGEENTVEIDGERVRISHATCPDQVCVQTGWIGHAGQTTVCLPNRLVVKLVSAGGNPDGIDVYVQ